MNIFIVLTLGFFVCTAQARVRTNPFEDFKTDVHPFLVKRCDSCHGGFQKPLHAVEDPAEAYKEARPLINLQFPDQSALWVRSYNGHCGKLDLCGVQQKELYDGLRQWIDNEKLSVVDNEEFKIVDSVTVQIPQSVGQETFFSIPSPKGEIYSFRLKRFSESVVYFYSPQIGQVKEGIVFDGLTLTSSDIQIKAQNFNELAKVIKPTMAKLPLTNDGGGYILGVLPQIEMSQANVTLSIKNYRFGLNLEELTQYFQKGYDPLYDQVILEVIPKIVKVATGNAHTCAVDEQNGVKCWGSNNYGALGLEIAGNIGLIPNDLGFNLPYLYFGKSQPITQIGIGNNHGCVLFADSKVKCWGDNYYGQLGINTTEYMGDQPNEMGDDLPYLNFGTPEKIKKIVVGWDSNCVLFENGKIKCWGINGSGQLGLGDTTNKGDSTANGHSLHTIPFLDFPAKAVDLFGGPHHNCAVFEKSVVKCWGDNDDGQLGVESKNRMGDNETAKDFKAVNLGTTAAIQFMALGMSNSCAYFTDDRLKCWGRNTSGELGLGSLINFGAASQTMGTNLPYVDVEPVQQLSLGNSSACALLKSGAVKCWGNNQDGKLGLGSLQSKGGVPEETVKKLPALDLGKFKVKEIAVGGGHACVVSKDGLLKCWGANNSGQLGIGTILSVGSSPGDMGEALSTMDFGQSKKVIF